MKGIERVSAIDVSAPRMEQGLPDAPNEVIGLMRLMRAANQALSGYLDLVLRPSGFTESTLHTLFLLFASDGGAAAPGALCELVGQTKANMTRILGTLATRRYVSRHDDASDGRRQVIRITVEGKRFVRSILPKISGPLALALGDMSTKEVQVLNGLLRRLVTSLDLGERQLRALV